MHLSADAQTLEDSVGVPGAGVAGIWESPNVRAGNQTRVLLKAVSNLNLLRPILLSLNLLLTKVRS